MNGLLNVCILDITWSNSTNPLVLSRNEYIEIICVNMDYVILLLEYFERNALKRKTDSIFWLKELKFLFKQ